MIPARALLLGLTLLTACTTGSTEVEGVDEGSTGEATGPTALTGTTAPTEATAPTGVTAPSGAEDAFQGPVSLDIPAGKNPTGAALFSCDGIEGTWVYEPGELPVQGIGFTVEAAPFDMSGGQGTLVIEGTITIPGAGEAGFVDTVELTIAGTPEAPTMTSSGVDVEASGALEGVPFDLSQFFPENASFPIVPGAAQC